MRKKLLATVLAASMVLAMAPVLPASTGTVASAEEATVWDLVGNGWWNAANVNSSRVNLAGEGSVTLYVGCTQALNGYSTFCIELNKDTNYITTTSRADIWGMEGATFEGKEVDTKEAKEGHLYKITVTRAGDDFTIEYYDVTEDAVFHTFKANGAAMGDSVDVYVIPQEGNMKVSTSQFEMPAVTPSEPTTPSEPETPATTVTSGIDFSKIETQPALKYTFDSADELALTGEANITDGVLNLATTATNSATYATLPDLTSYDFSNGVTLVADINVKGYTSDWTSIFMVGDGTIGGAGEDATAIYHLSQGFSSVGGLNGNYFEGYFGSGIAAPYTWDYYSNAANQGVWNSIAVTISKENMVTYMNGVKVQELVGDYTNVLQAFKVAKNNYLGASYWSADPDFVGSMDNVGIYTTALTEADMANLVVVDSSSTPSEPSTPSDDVETPAAKKMTVKVTAKKNATKVTGTVSVKKATVKVKVGKKAYKKATVKGKKFTLKCAKLTKGTKVTVKVTKSGYKAVTKTVKVK